MDDKTLEMWTVYDKGTIPHPEVYQCRKFEVSAGKSKPTQHLILNDSLEEMRDLMRWKGLNCIPRYPDDDPCIIETWL